MTQFSGSSTVYSEVAGDYDLARPGYPDELIDKFVAETKLDKDNRLLEIGCGTGQLTKKLSAFDLNIDALDIGADLLSIAQKNCQNHSKINFIQSAFEDYQASFEPYNVITSATAFHWVKPEYRYSKTAELLKSGGHLIIIQNIDDYANDKRPIRLAVNSVYEEMIPERKVLRLKDQSLKDKLDDILAGLRSSDNFTEPQIYHFKHEQTWSSLDYIKLLNTFSYQRAFPDELREKLYGRIKTVIDKHGGSISIPYIASMFVAQKL